MKEQEEGRSILLPSSSLLSEPPSDTCLHARTQEEEKKSDPHIPDFFSQEEQEERPGALSSRRDFFDQGKRGSEEGNQTRFIFPSSIYTEREVEGGGGEKYTPFLYPRDSKERGERGVLIAG